MDPGFSSPFILQTLVSSLPYKVGIYMAYMHGRHRSACRGIWDAYPEVSMYLFRLRVPDPKVEGVLVCRDLHY